MTDVRPRADRPHLPAGYGMEKAAGAPGERLPWNEVSEWLAAARNYWVSTTRPDGRPHAKPVWGLWNDDTFFFSTHPDTVTARNLRANPELAVHLESGDQAVILQGPARRTYDRSLLTRLGRIYEDKYAWPMSPEDVDPDNPNAAFYLAASYGLELEDGDGGG